MKQKAKKYINSLYIDYGDLNYKAEEQIKQAFIDGMNQQLILSGVSDIVHRAELKVLENVSDYIPCEIYSQAVIFSKKKRDNVR